MRAISLSLFLLLFPTAAFAQTCPEPLASARRIALVTSDGMTTSIARLQRFERATVSDKWRAVSGPQSALIGRNGMAWASAFRAFAYKGEPIKIDGDKRVPAGFYRVGASFGFAASARPGYLHVREGTVCVDQPESPAYNTIITHAKFSAAVRGENMWRVPAYRNGLLVNYPTDRRARAGSCIFIHVRLPSATGTAGCIAVPEPQVIELQDFAEAGAVLAVLPEGARSRFAGCLPVN
jgi:L,D-peptidoglycan transpeptidase YkuD (ErfK/YbiS/YcfS/YnhG family)